MPRPRRSIAVAMLVLILIGSIGLVHLSEQARFQAFHTVDVVQLLATGMCYGVALAGLLTLYVKPRLE